MFFTRCGRKHVISALFEMYKCAQHVQQCEQSIATIEDIMEQRKKRKNKRTGPAEANTATAAGAVKTADHHTHPTDQLAMNKLPLALIGEISSFLHDFDLHNFAPTCRNVFIGTAQNGYKLAIFSIAGRHIPYAWSCRVPNLLVYRRIHTLELFFQQMPSLRTESKVPPQRPSNLTLYNLRILVLWDTYSLANDQDLIFNLCDFVAMFVLKAKVKELWLQESMSEGPLLHEHNIREGLSCKQLLFILGLFPRLQILGMHAFYFDRFQAHHNQLEKVAKVAPYVKQLFIFGLRIDPSTVIEAFSHQLRVLSLHKARLSVLTMNKAKKLSFPNLRELRVSCSTISAEECQGIMKILSAAPKLKAMSIYNSDDGKLWKELFYHALFKSGILAKRTRYRIESGSDMKSVSLNISGQKHVFL